jgi:hypothetical protein
MFYLRTILREKKKLFVVVAVKEKIMTIRRYYNNKVAILIVESIVS